MKRIIFTILISFLCLNLTFAIEKKVEFNIDTSSNFKTAATVSVLSLGSSSYYVYKYVKSKNVIQLVNAFMHFCVGAPTLMTAMLELKNTEFAADEASEEYSKLKMSLKSSLISRDVAMNADLHQLLKDYECNECESDLEKASSLMNVINKAKSLAKENVVENGSIGYFSSQVKNHLKDEGLKDKLLEILRGNDSEFNVGLVYSIYSLEYMREYNRKFAKVSNED